MKILVAGGNCAVESLGIIVRELERSEHLAAYVPTRRIRKAGGLEAAAQAVTDVLASGWDCLLLWNVKGDLPADFLKRDQVKGKVARAWWTIDDPYLLDTENNPHRLAADIVLSCSTQAVEEARVRGQAAELTYPPVDIGLHDVVLDPELEDDICVDAHNCYTRDDYPHILAERREIARAVAPLGRLGIWGRWEGSRGWGTRQYGAPELVNCYRGDVTYAQMLPVYGSARISIGSHVRPDASGYLNQRVSDVMATGGFLLADAAKGILEHFTPGVHLDVWHNLDELREKATYWLAHGSEREQIALAGRKLVRQQWSSERWVARLVRLVEGL